MGTGSLRQAILNSNATSSHNRIEFKIHGTISLNSSLPTITTPVLIDGTTGAGKSAHPGIVLNGTNAVGNDLVDGLTIATNDTTVQGLVIESFNGSGVLIQGPAAHNVVEGDQIINNSGDGVFILGTGADHNRVVDDQIGLDGSGNAAGNGANAVEIMGGATHNTVANNVLVASVGAGVWIHDVGTSQNHVEANYIGTDKAGDNLGNQTNGIAIGFGSDHNTVTDGNVIGWNIGDGVFLFSTGTTGNRVADNFIGTNRTGKAAMGNTAEGVDIEDGANGNTVGGRGWCWDGGNVIAFNGDYGVMVNGSSQNAILSNSIYGNVNGGIGLFNGGNNNQPAPTLSSVTFTHGKATLSGNLGQANTWEFIQVFKDTPTGQVLIFSGMVHSDSSGSFHIGLHCVRSGDELTATATTGHNTSQFADDLLVP
jgi:titin